ncbi:MAG: hypothetical protein A2505_08325 [Deltaproteobacteria bacterium RIFOXYD12_FULL_55_16]|nr:MAG: hypothetical protein A2505_08325 [Deltaproteobacteria bacterium RIFOXYD12_FULL_55_16]
MWLGPSDFNEILADGEGMHVAFKDARSWSPDSFFRTICAFLNTFGGTIYLGVNAEGTVIGVAPQAVAQIKKEIVKLARNRRLLDPHFPLSPHEFAFGDKIVIAVQVPLSSQIHRHGRRIIFRSAEGDYRLRETPLKSPGCPPRD